MQKAIVMQSFDSGKVVNNSITQVHISVKSAFVDTTIPANTRVINSEVYLDPLNTSGWQTAVKNAVLATGLAAGFTSLTVWNISFSGF